jgi:signal transduction histidine kinase/PAS domain-containing protein
VAGEAPDLRHVLVEVPMGGPDALWTRGVLLIASDVAVVLVLWLLTGVADGGMGRLLAWRRRRWRRSFRVRLSGALVGFFLAPALAFAAWGGLQLQDNDRAARELLLREALRVAEAERAAGQFGAAPSATGAPLFLYEGGVLAGASDPLLAALAPLGRLLPAALGAADSFSPDERFVTARVPVGGGSALVGYRQLDAGAAAVLATPARGDEFALDARRSDLGMLVLCVALLGALAAVVASGWAARTLAEPVRALREAALALAAGRRPRLPGTAPTSEFVPVYQAFGRMARDLAASRAALEASQRQTAAVLEQVASGVLALDQQGGVVLVNPQAAELLGMPAGVAPRAEAGGLAPAPALPPAVAPRCLAFLAGSAPDDEFDLVLSGRQLRGRLTRLAGGAVLTLDDVTALASAQRVLAWGEMARQVAHEIKNPLTPIRLGVQHLRRAFRDGRSDFAQVLDTNVTRVLAEIDRLDGIARAFSRYGTAPEARAALEAVDVGRVAADVVALEQLGHEGPVHWALEVRAAAGAVVCAHGRAEELAKVLLNLLENARLADARTVRVTVSATGREVTVAVTDDGTGIAPEVLPRVFEPHFSTRTSGSGLGLAISRRLVEGWGGTLVLESVPGTGTTARLTLPRCPADAPDT